jgi:hypothetical protein
VRTRPLLALLAVLAAAASSPAHAGATTEDEVELAQRFAPVVQLVDQPEPCGPGEPYQPTDVDAVLGRDDVALRGPWTTDDLVTVAPGAEDLAPGLLGYHLDLPGNPLKPGCSYEEWSDLVTAGTQPTVYAHVATEQQQPGRLALQYWLYYPFNDYNNKHESDWEMIQLEFAADDAAAALESDPVRLAYSQHEGAEVSGWDDVRVEVVDGTHPVVRPAAGSHANYFGDALYLGRSASQGFGCDDARGPSSAVRPSVQVVPSSAGEARTAFPWVAYEGHWGQREEAFYNGPTGPATKTQWEQPFTWTDEEGRDHSYAVPASSLFGTGATDLFCTGVATGSDAFRVLTADPVLALGALAVGVLLVWLLARLTAWRPSTPLRLVRRRTIGQVLTASMRMYRLNLRVLMVIGLLAVPATALGSWASQVGESASGGTDVADPSAWLALGGLAGAVVSVVAVVVVQAAAMQVAAERDAGREVSARRALALVGRRLPASLGAGALFVVALTVLFVTLVLTPVALVLGVLWLLWLPASQLERLGPWASLRRSAGLVRHRVVPVVLLIGAANLAVSAMGPLLGFGVLLLAADVPFVVGNAVAGVTYALLSPFIGVVTAYVHADAVARSARRVEEPEEEALPAEGTLTPADGGPTS